MKYEMLYLIDSSMADEARDALISKFEGTVATLGGTVLSTPPPMGVVGPQPPLGWSAEEGVSPPRIGGCRDHRP